MGGRDRKLLPSAKKYHVADLIMTFSVYSTSEVPWQLGTSEYQGRSIESKEFGELLGEGGKLREAKWEILRKPNIRTLSQAHLQAKP